MHTICFVRPSCVIRAHGIQTVQHVVLAKVLLQFRLFELVKTGSAIRLSRVKDSVVAEV